MTYTDEDVDEVTDVDEDEHVWSAVVEIYVVKTRMDTFGRQQRNHQRMCVLRRMKSVTQSNRYKYNPQHHY